MSSHPLAASGGGVCRRMGRTYKDTKKDGGPDGPPPFLLGDLLGGTAVPYWYCRYRKVTIWARVQPPLGEKAPAPVPWVMPFFTAHCTAPAQ